MKESPSKTDHIKWVFVFQTICFCGILYQYRNQPRWLVIAPLIFVFPIYYRRQIREFLLPTILWTLGFYIFFENYYAGVGLWIAAVWLAQRMEERIQNDRK